MNEIDMTYNELVTQNEILKKELAKYKEQDIQKFDLSDNIEFHDLFKLDEIQNIQDLFAEATGVASIITSPNGIPITKPSNFCRLCNDIIRKTEKGLKDCYHSAAAIGKQSISGAIFKPCLSCGLWNAGASISVGEKHIANWLIGQIKNEDIDETKMLLYAHEIGADEEEFKKAFNEVSIMPTEKFKKIADTLFYFANEISNRAYQNIVKNQLINKFQQKYNENLKLNEEYKSQNENLIFAKEKAEKQYIQIKDSEQKLLNIFKNSTNLFYSHTINHIFTYLSPQIESILGYTAEQAMVKWTKLAPDSALNASAYQYTQKAIDTGIAQAPYEVELFHKNGKIVLFQVREYPIVENGKTISMVGSLIDITDWKKAENDLKRQNKEYILLNEELIVAKEKAEESDQLKTEFINNMSHEIRTPMNGILGFSEFLNNENLSKEKRKHYISIIQNSGNQLMRIIDDILEISRLGTRQVKTFLNEICLNDLLLEHFSIFDMKAKENRTPLYLKKGLSDKESIIFTDKTKLNKILSNLLENALKFTNEGFIEFGYTINKDSEPAELEIYVKDTGIGIKQEKQEIIFERFSQEEKELSKKVGGLGLGLSIAKENTELLGGKITLQSEKGKGATFFITIPYKPVENSDTMILNHRSNEKSPIKNSTILIVEDEEINYLYIDILLENIELSLITLHAKHGKEAIEICKENTEIKLVLMDLKMPIMNGFEATRLIKEFRPDLPIVAQTAYSTNNEKEQASIAGCDDFISKPISKEILNGIIDKFLIM